MAEELIVYEATKAIAETHGKNYTIQPFQGAPATTLKRDVDFGVIPKTKKPSLYKSGAEKICMSYGLFQRYNIETAIERAEPENPFFYYLIKCSLVKLVDGKEYVFCTGYGSANTNEKRNGFNSAWDAANGTLKMAQKRALTGAAIAISGLSDMFTQDIENDDFMQGAKALVDTDNPESPVNTQQIRRLYAIGKDAGLTANEVKNKLAVLGYTSTKQILQKDYNRICDELDKSEVTD